MTRPQKSAAVGSPESKGAYGVDDDFNLFEDKTTESRLRPRTGPRRAYNYLDADSSDDEHSKRHKRHTPVSPVSIKKELLEESRSRTRQRSNRLSCSLEDVADADLQVRRSQRQMIAPQPIEIEVNVRRSVRRPTQTEQKEDEEDFDGEHQKDQESDDDIKDQEDSDNEENAYSDIYSRVKRKRIRRQRHFFDDERNTNNNQDSDDEGPSSSRRKSVRLRTKPQEIVKSYSLREHKPRTVHYTAPVEERKVKKPNTSIFETTPTKKTCRQPYQSPAQRRKTKKRSAMHSSSSSTSSSGESSDEKSFKKRKAKSMAKARSRLMPMNFDSESVSSVVKDRVKSGASLADVEPMTIDKNITFDSIGGLGKHIRALKEMVVFPLLYDKVFQRFNADPPRGVLFYGPPGTGKTLVARALANECSQGNKRVAFFMRKGADCLSKWVGESERQLRLLFDQAYKYRPSIIFFDEIDGLAPVRSSRQDQIHNSIVSTLLALMDGLDSRGEIVVIGATNRIDSLDPALRRAGRFDREFLFPLPSVEARKQILKIQTSEWNPKLNDHFITELAEKTVGYCGADLKALCTESAMFALRRTYPQIYVSNEALQLDVSTINVSAKDFFNAINNIIPTSCRSVNPAGRPLSLHIRPLLEKQFMKATNQLGETFPSCFMKSNCLDAAATVKQVQSQLDTEMDFESFESDEDDTPSIFVSPGNKGRTHIKRSHDPMMSKHPTASAGFLNYSSFSSYKPATFRPRILVTGNAGQGQTSYLAPALIHQMEDLPVHVLDLPALYAVTAKTPEESCACVFQEARRKCPSIIYMPYINQWWDVLGDTLRTTLLTLIQDLNPTTPILLLATSEQPYLHLDSQLKFLFSEISGEVIKMTNPKAEDRKAFFTELLLHYATKPPTVKKSAEDFINEMEKTHKTHFLPLDVSKPQKKLMSRYTKIDRKRTRSSNTVDYRQNMIKLKTVRTPMVKGRNNNNYSEEDSSFGYQSTSHVRSRILSSGSVQMLSRKHEHSLYSKSVMSLLPINLAQLKRKPLRYNTRTQAKIRSCHIDSCRRFYKTKRMLEKLPKATPPTPRELTEQEMDALREKEELTLMELRIFLRDVLHKLGSDKKFTIFTKPVDLENAPDYLDVIESPMDMSTMMSKIDCHEYNTVCAFMDDIDMICSNALEYNPDRGPMDKVIRHRACALKDTAYAIIKTELDKEFEKTCVDIEQSRKRRGVSSTTVPNFYRTKPVTSVGGPSSSKTAIPSYLDSNRPPRSIPKPDGERYSRRVRGLVIDPTPSLEIVERTARSLSFQTAGSSGQNEIDEQVLDCSTKQVNSIGAVNKSMSQEEMNSEEDTNIGEDPSNSSQQLSQTDPLHKRPRSSKCVWCRPKRRKRRKGFKEQVMACKKRLLLKRLPVVLKSAKSVASVKSPPMHQPLNIEINAGNSESDMKSPMRKSTRLLSPSSSAGGITTRRQSHSPGAHQSSIPQPVELTVTEDDMETGKETDVDHKEDSLPNSDKNKEVTAASSEKIATVEQGQDKTIPEDMPLEGSKPSVVKSLDLDFIAADSGAGSSLDGNGDSRDSTDNRLQDPMLNSSHNNTRDFNKNNLNEAGPSNTFVVPTERLSKLLDRLVVASEGFTVERLEKIYSQISQIIFKFRQLYNRLPMVDELEDKVSQLTQPLSGFSPSIEH